MLTSHFAKIVVRAAGRGGWGHLKNREEMEAQRQREVEDTYRSDHDASGAGREVPTGAGMPDEVSVSLCSDLSSVGGGDRMDSRALRPWSTLSQESTDCCTFFPESAFPRRTR